MIVYLALAVFCFPLLSSALVAESWKVTPFVGAVVLLSTSNSNVTLPLWLAVIVDGNVIPYVSASVSLIVTSTVPPGSTLSTETVKMS